MTRFSPTKSSHSGVRITSLAFLVLFATATTSLALTYTVTNTNDTLTAGTLRQAITDANAHANSPVGTPDRIHFSIPGNGPHTISPTSALPTITDPVVIDGYTQGDSTGTIATDDALENTNPVGQALNTVLKIELNGTSAGATDALVVQSGGTTIRGLCINRFSGAGINLQVNGGNTIEGCFLGTNVTGTAKLQNAFSGIYIESSSNNLIGGTTAAARNLSSANHFHGVEITGGTTSGNTVQGNLIGTNAAGTAALNLPADESYGVYIWDNAHDNLVGGTVAGSRNLLSGNTDAGVRIEEGAYRNTVQGNFIGTDITGTAAIGNGQGVSLTNTDDNLIGGTTAAARNIISGNINRGITTSGAVTRFNLIQGNYIGTDVNGTAAVPNQLDGIRLRSPNNTIGGTDAGAGNVISGNGANGVFVTEVDAHDNQISQNLIGRNAANNGPLGNVGHGILLESSGPNTIGGGFNPNNANTIAHNGGDGVAVVFGTGPCIKKGIVSNSIYSNGGLGIDLENDGVTPNDAGDGDTGANTLQNFPVLTSASTGGGNTTINGSLNSTASTSFHIEFFASAAADPTGYGEGQTFLGFKDVTTDPGGNIGFTAVLPVTPPAGQTMISATTTDNNELANTSEFSKAVQLAGTAGQLLNISTRGQVLTGNDILIGGLIITGSDPKTVMLRVVGPSLNDGGTPVPGRLADPTLTLHDGSGAVIVFRDNWGDASEPERTQIENSPLKPDDALEPAIMRTLSPGSYTAVVRGKDGTTGIGLVEVYDLDPSDSTLANISTRGITQSGNNVLIGGVIVGGGGGGSARLLVRGIGPSLSSAGVSNPIPDPTLELHDGNGALLVANDNWKDTQQTEIQATGIPPSNDAESAIVMFAPPGRFTAILQDKNGTSGIGLVELFRY